MILCIGATPAAQRVMVFRQLALDHVNRASTTLDGAAGKAVNVAKVLKALGEAAVVTGFLGGPRGEEVRAWLQARGIELEFVTVAAPTRQCITVIDQAAGAITELVEESRPVAPTHYEQLLAVIRCRLHLDGQTIPPAGAAGEPSRPPDSGRCRAVIMSGTITPGGPVDFYFRCTQMAHAAGAIPVVDAQGASLLEALKAKPGLVKPNRAELAATVGHELADESALLSAMRELCQRGAQRVLVTAGKAPALACDGRNLWRIHPPAIAALNPIGSGDASTAALVWRLVRGDDLGEACRWAAAAGAANALTLMPGDLEPREVERLAPQIQIERL